MKKKIIIALSVLFLVIAIFLICRYMSTYTTIAKIPKIYLEGDISNMTTKKDEREVVLKYRSANINFDKNVKIKIQGGSSIYFEKKNYTINFYEDSSYETKEKVDVGFGWGEQSKYCLKANWIDKTHSRNIVAARIMAKVQERYGLFKDTPHNGTIDGFPVEMYINGKFLGLYTWNIPKDEWMWNMDKDNSNHIILGAGGSTQTTLFREELAAFGDENTWEVEVGEENQDTLDKLNRLINFINNTSNGKFIKDFDLYLNKDATINYLVLMYTMEAMDNSAKNMMLVTYDGKVWYPSLYDLDSTFGTDPMGNAYTSYETPPIYSDARLWNRMLECFPEEIADRYFELREDILKKENILKEFTDFINEIPTATYKKETNKWKEIPGQDIKQIEEFLNIRLPYLDNLMDGLKNNTLNRKDLVIN